MASLIAEALATALSGYLLTKFSAKNLLIPFFCISIAAGLIIIFYNSENAGGFFVFLVLMAKFGISGAFTIVYVAHPKMFPTLFSVTSMGIANWVSRLMTSFAPMVAEVDEPTPMLIFTILCIISTICTFFLKEPEQNQH